MIFVADAGPIISFARADRLALLHQVVGELWIPEAVYQELVTKGAGRPGAEETTRGEWIRRKPITQQAMVRTLPSPLGEGEREAIILAQELAAVLLVDDPDARDTAARLGILFLGSLGMLREAKLKGIIHAVKPHLDALRQHHFRLSDTLYQDFLQQIGEA
jgi:predicted nucleic acid-binding protein